MHLVHFRKGTKAKVLDISVSSANGIDHDTLNRTDQDHPRRDLGCYR